MKTLRRSFALFATVGFVFGAQLASAMPAPLKVGDKAPLVSGMNQDGVKWKLADEIGRNVVLLYFYPKDDTPGCTKEACSLRDRIGDLKSQNVDVVGVSFDSMDSHKSFIFKYDLNFPLIADVDGKIADAYRARMGPKRRMDRRISFLIDMDGRLRHITESPDPAVHLAEMQEAIKKLNSKGSK